MILNVKNISIHYKKAAAVRDVSFKVEKGSIVTIIGANGAGKTTILKAILGLKDVTSGEILFREQKIHGLATHSIVKMGISLVPEGRKLFPEMSVLENILMGAYLQNDREKTKRELNRIYEYFPVLKKRQQQRAGSLSGGEQQMLAIGRALMSKPLLLLLDEPSTGLAPLIIQHLGEIIHVINKNGVSILIVEQNAKIALKLAHMGYVLETGSIVLKGKTDMLMKNEAVKKAYLGS